jgi:hypothetical protein
MLPTPFANTPRVPREIPLHNLHLQTTFLPLVRPYSHQSHRKRKGEYVESQIVVSVAGMTRRTSLVSRRRWSLAMSVVVVVGFYRRCTWNLADFLQAIQLAWILALSPISCVPTHGNALNARPARFVRRRATMYACDPLRICYSLTRS